MNYIKETVKQPKLVNNPVVGSSEITKIIKKHKKHKRYSFQIIILILFVMFFMFFLYNCRDGRMFGGNLIVDPIPYSFINS
jgi:Fe2+ transport system protein B